MLFKTFEIHVYDGLFQKITFNEEQFDIYKYSFLGLYNSIIGRKSFYRI